jgi:hypothetical protein
MSDAPPKKTQVGNDVYAAIKAHGSLAAILARYPP